MAGVKGGVMVEQLYLAIGSNAWGSGPSVKEAVAAHRQARGRRLACTVLKVPMGVTEVWVDDMGYTTFNVAAGYSADALADAEWPIVKEFR